MERVNTLITMESPEMISVGQMRGPMLGSGILTAATRIESDD